MRVLAIIAFLSCYCSVSSQLVFSKKFDANKKSVPVCIVNPHASSFFVVRYNRTIHDFTVERRKKISSEILSFSALRLDSVNSSWFDYDKLDYQCFSKNSLFYFVFKTQFSGQESVYMKIIDSLGKSSGFIQLSSVRSNAGDKEVSAKFSVTEEKDILLITTHTAGDYETTGDVKLYDVAKKKMVWEKKFPRYNAFAEEVNAFAVNHHKDLLYVKYYVDASVVIHETKQIRLINKFKTLTLVKLDSSSAEPLQRPLKINNLEAVYSATLLPWKNDVYFCGQVVGRNTGGYYTYLYTESIAGTLDSVRMSYRSEMKDSLKASLSFYDGSDQNNPAFKNYSLHFAKLKDSSITLVTQRSYKDHYREVLCWRININNGSCHADVLPRKIFYFESRERYKNFGKLMTSNYGDSLRIYLLEHPANSAMNTTNFRYKKYTELNSIHGYVVQYKGSGNTFSKSFLHQNKNYSLVPVNYLSETVKDEVFYLTRGNEEKFAFLINP